jgi:PAS domain-containing protein
MSAGARTWETNMKNQEERSMNMDADVCMGVMLCTESACLAAAVKSYFEGAAGKQTDSGTIAAYPLQMVTPEELASTPGDLSNTVVVVAGESDEANLRTLDIATERLPGVSTIIAMSDFDPMAESLYMNHGAFDVAVLPASPDRAAQAIYNRVQRIERIMLQLSQAQAAEQQQRLTNSVLDRALSRIPQSIAVLDRRGQIEYVNRSMARLAKVAKHSLEGTKIGSWLTPSEGTESPEATLMMWMKDEESDSKFRGTLKRADSVEIGTSITATPFSLNGQQKCILMIEGENEAKTSSWDASDNIYNIHSYSQNNRSDFIQWIEDVSAQARSNPSMQMGVLTVRLHGLDDLQPDDIHSFTDDVSEDAARILSLMASDYCFGIWDDGVLAIGMMCELPRGFNAIMSKIELLLDQHPLSEHGVICLEGVVGISDPQGASIMASIANAHRVTPSISDGVFVSID